MAKVYKIKFTSSHVASSHHHHHRQAHQTIRDKYMPTKIITQIIMNEIMTC